MTNEQLQVLRQFVSDLTSADIYSPLILCNERSPGEELIPILKAVIAAASAHEPEVGETFPPETLRLAKEASERVAGPIPGNPINDWKLGEEPPSQGYCGNWPCRLPKYHTGPCNSSPSQRTGE